MRCFSILLSSHQYCWGPSRSLPSSSGATNKRGKTPCPGCEKTTVNTTEDSSRIWCSNRRYTFSYIRNTPFGGRTLTPGAVVTAFSTLVGYSVSIRSLGVLRLSPTVSIRRSKRWQPPLSAASPSSGNTPTHACGSNTDRRNRIELLQIQTANAAAGRPLPRRVK